jgi:hypothetical protein
MRLLIITIIAGAFLAACSDAKFTCTDSSQCSNGGTCDPSGVCVIAGGCDHVCASNEKCVAAVCVAQSCPVCNANQNCNTITFTCDPVTDGSIALVAPVEGGVIGGATTTVTARAGAPNGGPVHVDFALTDSTNTPIGSTVSVTTGDAQGNYTATLDLSSATTSTGNKLTASVFWKDASGTLLPPKSASVTISIDKTAPSITAITTDRAFYSAVVGGTATVSATIADSGGSSGINNSSVQLTVGRGTPVAGTLQSGTTYQFAVPVSGLAAGANAFTITAADAVTNIGTQTGTLNIDNTAPAFGAISVPSAFFSGTATVAPAITAAITDSGGSGVSATSVKLKLDATHAIDNDSFSAGTATWNSLTGASFLLPNGQQGAVSFTVVGADNAGNPVESAAQSIKIDRKGPAVANVTPPPFHGCTGNLTVTADVDDDTAHGGSGAGSAVLHVGAANITAGSSTGTTVETFSFTVPASTQTAGSEAPIPFTVTGTDAVGNVTPTASAGASNLLIDCAPPVVTGITISATTLNGTVEAGVLVSGVEWFKQAGTGDIKVTATIHDGGAGVNTGAGALRLKTTVGGVVLDGRDPTCSTPANGTVTCDFLVALSRTVTGGQQAFTFEVAGSDLTGNTIAVGGANPSSKLGIDGTAPTIRFNLADSSGGTGTLPAGSSGFYPSPGASCNGGSADNALFCGHDGLHLYRKGETNSVIVVSDDGLGSGVTAAGVTYAIAGSTNCTNAAPCTVTATATPGQFSFTPDFSSATFTSGADGTGTASVTFTAKDAVGNAGTVTSSVAVTRIRWVRSMAGKVDSFKASPVITTVPTAQIIFAGNERDLLGPMVSLSPDGSVIWRAGHGDELTISNNTAYSSTTQRLYVLGDNAVQMFAYDVGNVVSGVAPRSFACTLDDAILSSGLATGSPTILTGTPERVLVADSGEHRLWAFQKATTAGTCATVDKTNNGGLWAGSVNAPTTDGANIFLAHDGNALSALTFTAGAFGAVHNAVPFSIGVFGPVSIAGNLFFGDTNAGPHLYSYSSDGSTFTSSWTTTAALADPLNASAVVTSSLVFGVPFGTNDGHFHAFNKSSGIATFTWPTTAAKIGTVSAPALGVDGLIYFTDSNRELLVLNNTPAVPTAWGASFTGSAAQTIPASTNTLIDSVSTEPTLDASGALYFGTQAGKIYSIITDSNGTLAPVAGSTWPRVGYDNCNSNNTAFSCQ